VDGWQWQLGIAGGATFAWALGLALFALWLFELRSIRGESDRRRRAALGVLGGLGVLGVYLLALQITLVRETFEEVAGGTVVLVDSSRSMTLSGSDGPRDDAVRSLITGWQEDGRVNPMVYLFGSSTRGAVWDGLAEDYRPTDDTTNIREALDYALANDAGREIGSVTPWWRAGSGEPPAPTAVEWRLPPRGVRWTLRGPSRTDLQIP